MGKYRIKRPDVMEKQLVNIKSGDIIELEPLEQEEKRDIGTLECVLCSFIDEGVISFDRAREVLGTTTVGMQEIYNIYCPASDGEECDCETCIEPPICPTRCEYTPKETNEHIKDAVTYGLGVSKDGKTIKPSEYLKPNESLEEKFDKVWDCLRYQRKDEWNSTKQLAQIAKEHYQEHRGELDED